MTITRRRHIQVNAGDRYSRLIVVEEVEPRELSGKPCRQVLCECDCGRRKLVLLKDLRAGSVKSCGCLHDTLPIKHGHAKNGERGLTYSTWLTMRARCLNHNASGYNRYGGRGICICRRWDDFAAFIEDMGERPSPAHSIDRINPNGDYSPDNCRWSTAKEQGRNRGNNRVLSYGGETMCLSEWAERTGMSLEAIRGRLDVCGYTIEEALTLPIGVKRQDV